MTEDTPPMGLVEEAIRSWEQVRAGTIAELENVPEEQWGHRVAEGSRTIREVARHIAELGRGFVDELLSPEPSFAKLMDPAHLATLRDALPAPDTRDGVLALLRQTGAENVARLRARGESIATEQMKTMAGAQSRLTGLYFAVGHESYHRGQLALLARSVGRVPALTQQLESRRRKA